jgi:hypothetical protein
LRAAKHPEIKVVNAGIPGYGTHQEVLLFERIVDRILPDAVLLGFFIGNDFADNLSLNKHEVIDGYLVTVSRHGTRLSLTEQFGIPAKIKIALRTRLHLYTFLMNAWSAALVSAGLADTTEMFEIYREDPSQETMKAFDVTRRSISQLAAACRKRNLSFGLIIIPDGRVATVLVTKGAGYRFGRPAEILLEMAKTEGVPALDLSRIFDEKKDRYFPVDGHWNVQGHLVAGHAIAESLLRGELRSIIEQWHK